MLGVFGCHRGAQTAGFKAEEGGDFGKGAQECIAHNSHDVLDVPVCVNEAAQETVALGGSLPVCIPGWAAGDHGGVKDTDIVGGTGMTRIAFSDQRIRAGNRGRSANREHLIGQAATADAESELVADGCSQ